MKKDGMAEQCAVQLSSGQSRLCAISLGFLVSSYPIKTSVLADTVHGVAIE